MIYKGEIDKQIKAYEYSFLIENMLRVSMHNIMVKKEGLTYFHENIFPEYEYKGITSQKKINVVTSAKQRKGTERKYNIWLGYDYPYYWYLDFSVLISLLDAFWDNYFHAIFKSRKKKTKEDILSRLKRVIPIRNAVAHHRYISNIDINDLESLFTILKASLNESYLNNFYNIALNSFENLVRNFVRQCDEIKNFIKRGKYLDKSKIDELKSLFSALLSDSVAENVLDEFNEIIDILIKYNRLPRKPGRGNEISHFRSETNLEEKISLLAKHLGDHT